jgi:hypothetical protein
MKDDNTLIPFAAITISKAEVIKCATAIIEEIESIRAKHSIDEAYEKSKLIAVWRNKLWSRLLLRKLSDQEIFAYYMNMGGFDVWDDKREWSSVSTLAMFAYDNQYKRACKLKDLAEVEGTSENMFISDEGWAQIRPRK